MELRYSSATPNVTFLGTHESIGTVLDTVFLSGEGPFEATTNSMELNFETSFEIVDGFIRLNSLGYERVYMFGPWTGKLDNLFDESTSGYEPYVVAPFLTAFNKEWIDRSDVVIVYPHVWNFLQDIFDATPVSEIIFPSSPWTTPITTITRATSTTTTPTTTTTLETTRTITPGRAF